MSAGVIPTPEERRRPATQIVATVHDLSGRPLHIGYSGDAVTIGGYAFSLDGQETFAQVFVRACHYAAQNSG